MAFAKIPKLPSSDKLFKQCLHDARPKPMRRRKEETPLQASRKFERERLFALRDQLSSRLKKIVTTFPSVDGLSEFYRELISTHIRLDDYKRILGRIQYSSKTVHELSRTYKGRLEAADSIDDIKKSMSAYIGRLASVIDRLDESFAWLNEVAKMLGELPVVKKQFTVCIAGFPNVGKTTLFEKITGSAAEVNSYAFTTKRLNVGSAKFDHYTVQFIDTPGTLNRDHNNAIEEQAALALKYVADLIIYVFDPTEQYSYDKQQSLRETMNPLRADTIEFVSKLDIASDEQQERFVIENRVTDVDDLRELLLSQAKKYYRL